MRAVKVLAASRGLEQPQGLPRELVQVGGTDVAAALGLGAVGRQSPRRRELVQEQSGEARVLGKKGQVVRAGAPGPGTHTAPCPTRNP